MHLFETTEEFMKFLDVPERRSLLESIREAGMATKKVGSTTAKATGVVTKSVKEGEQLTKKVITGAEKAAGVDTGNRMGEYGELQQMQPENAKIAGDTSNKVTEAYKMSAGALLGETGVPDGGPGN